MPNSYPTVIADDKRQLQYWSSAPVPKRKVVLKTYVDSFNYARGIDPGAGKNIYYKDWPRDTRCAAWYVLNGQFYLVGFDSNKIQPKIILKEGDLD